MPRILSLSPSGTLRTTRHLILEQDGHAVISPADLSEIDDLPKEEKLDMAVIGHGFKGVEKRRMAHALNTRFPGLPILELCFHSPEIPGADFLLTDSPAELVAGVREVLAGRRVRGYAT